MGCVSSHKQPKKAKNIKTIQSTKIEEITEPEIRNEDLHSKFPHIEVTEFACGYNFTSGDHQSHQFSLEQAEKKEIIISFNTLIQQCLYYYQEHDIDNSYELLQKIDDFANQYKYSQKYGQEIENILKKCSQEFNTIRQQHQSVIQYQNQVLKGGWIEKSNRKGVKVSTRRQETTVGVLVQSIIDQPFEVIISFCIEMDLYKQFMPFMKVSRQQKIVARNSRIGYTQNHIPIISVREAFFQGIGYNRLHKNNTLFLYTRSIHDRPDLQEKLGYKCQVNQKNVQLEYKYFILWYEPICRGKGKITLAMNVDTKMNFIPLWLQDKISQDFGQQFFENIIKLSSKFKNSQWEKNTKENPELFLFFKNAIEKRLQEIQQSAAKSQPKVTSTDRSYPAN